MVWVYIRHITFHHQDSPMSWNRVIKTFQRSWTEFWTFVGVDWKTLTVVEKYMAQSLHIGLYRPSTNLPSILTWRYQLRFNNKTVCLWCETWVFNLRGSFGSHKTKRYHDIPNVSEGEWNPIGGCRTHDVRKDMPGMYTYSCISTLDNYTCCI